MALVPKHLLKASVMALHCHLLLNWGWRNGSYSAWSLFFSASNENRMAAFASVVMSMIFNEA